MTKAQVKYIVEDVLNSNVNITTPLVEAKYIHMSRFENKYVDINNIRFKFVYDENDDDKCWMEIVTCRKSKMKPDEVPNTWVLNEHYDIYNDNVYVYSKNSLGQIVKDIYDYDNIILFGMGV